MTLHYDKSTGVYIGGVKVGISRTCRFLRDQAGWTIPLSGINGAGPTGDNLGSGDFITNDDWACIESPDGNKQIIFTASGNANIGGYVYSPGALFTGGTPTSRATATDELTLNYKSGGTYLWRDGTSVPAIWYADDEYPYGWYVCSITSTSFCNCFVCFDPLTDTDPSDTDPYILYAMADDGPTAGYMGAYAQTANSAHCAGTIAGYSGTISALRYYTGSTLMIPGKGPNNVFSGYEQTWPVYFGQSGYLSPMGYKGVGTIVRWNGQAHSYGDTLNNMTRFCVGDCNIPWNGTTP